MRREQSKKSQTQSAMVPTVGQNRSKRENKQIQAGSALRALQDQLDCLKILPIQTPEDARAAVAKGKAFVIQYNNLKKALYELQPQQQDTVTPVFHRLQKQGDLAAANREQEQAQQFYEEAKSKFNALVQQYQSWDKQVKKARKEAGGSISSNRASQSDKKCSVALKRVSKSLSSVRSPESGEFSVEKIARRTNSSKLVDDDGFSRMMPEKRESKEIVKMVDGGSGDGKKGGFGSEGNCVAEKIGELLSGRSSVVDLREIEEDQRLALEGDMEKRLFAGGCSSSRFNDLRGMKSDEDSGSLAIVLADEGRDVREHDGNVTGIEGINETFEYSVSEESMEFPRQPKIVESFGSNDHEHGEDESKEECDSDMTKTSGIQILIRPPDQDSKGNDKVVDTDEGSRLITFEKKPSVLEQASESICSNDEKNGPSDDDGVSSNRAEVGVRVGSPKEKLKGAPAIPRQRSLDIDSKLSKWRNEVHFDNEESPLPVWQSSNLSKSEEEELESLKECWKLREENMKVPVKMQRLEDLSRSFLDKQSQQKLHGFHAQTMPKFENHIEELSALDAAEENIMEVAAGVKPLDAMNEIVMMEDLLSHNKMSENPLNSSFEWKIIDPEGNKFSELEKEIERVPSLKKFTDVHFLEEELGKEEEEENAKPAVKAIRRPQSRVTFDEKVYNGREKSELNLKYKEELVRMNILQSPKLTHQTFMKEPVAENLYAKDEDDSATQCSEESTELGVMEGVEEAVQSGMKSPTRNVSSLVFNIQNSTNCFFPESAPVAPAPSSAPPPPPGINIVKQSPRFRALEKRMSKVEEKQLKAEREFEEIIMEKAQKKGKNKNFRTWVLSVLAIFSAGLACAIYKVEKSPPPT